MSPQWWPRARVPFRMPASSKSQLLCESNSLWWLPNDVYHLIAHMDWTREWLLPVFTDASLNAIVRKGALTAFPQVLYKCSQKVQNALWVLGEGPCRKTGLVCSPRSKHSEEAEWASVVVEFWSSSRSRHVSHCIRGVPREQQTQHASTLITGPSKSLGSILEPTLDPSYMHGYATIRSLSVTTSIRIMHSGTQLWRSYSASWRP